MKHIRRYRNTPLSANQLGASATDFVIHPIPPFLIGDSFIDNLLVPLVSYNWCFAFWRALLSQFELWLFCFQEGTLPEKAILWQ